MSETRKVAVVTGASRGIGKQLAVDLAKHGFDVACLARSSREQPSRLPGTVEETADLVRRTGREALAVSLDVRDEDAIAAFAERLFSSWGRCDLLVNNAAVAPPLRALDDTTRRWRLAVDVNLNGPFYFLYHLGRRMREQGDARAVNLSSLAAAYPAFGRASYTATKLALEGLSQALGHDLAGRVAVNCLRIDVPVWSEGFDATLSGEHGFQFEDPVIISDAVLWLTRQPLAHTAKIHSVTELRAEGVVRPQTFV
ncbi:MAG TPA: SDR family NAD(P)-dependent oxidoreductase [Myxococcota bacterium]|jgi:NAD(P)-dependent dehydrogenase (short-subunit alcohol dehydrogenase family)